MELPSNPELAVDYFTTMTDYNTTAKAATHYRKIRDMISGLNIDVAKLFMETRSLSSLTVDGLPKTAKHTLEIRLKWLLKARRASGHSVPDEQISVSAWH